MSKTTDGSRRDVLKAAGAVALGLAATRALPTAEALAAESVPRWAFIVDLRR